MASRLVPISFPPTQIPKLPAPYHEYYWETTTPTSANLEDVGEDVYSIIEHEGPVSGNRVYAVYMENCAVQKSDVNQKLIQRALTNLREDGWILESNPLNRKSVLDRTFRIDQPLQTVRQIGPRALAEVHDEEKLQVLNAFPEALSEDDLVTRCLGYWKLKGTDARKQEIRKWVKYSNWSKSKGFREPEARESLEAIEIELNKRLHSKLGTHSSTYEQPLLLVDLKLCKKELEIINQYFRLVLRATSPSRSSLSNLLTDFKLSFLFSLHAVEQNRHAAPFWDAYKQEFEIDNADLFASIVRENLFDIYRVKRLATFDKAILGNTRYVQLITLHAGINQEMTDQVLRDLDEDKSARETAEDFNRIAMSLVQHYIREDVDFELTKAATLIPAHLTKFILAIALQHAQKDTAVDNAPLCEVLPEGIKTYVSDRIAGKEESVRTKARKVRHHGGAGLEPYIRFSTETLAMEIEFPAGNACTPEGIVWSIRTQNNTSSFTQPYEWSTGKTRESSFKILRPPSTIEVDSTLGSWSFDLRFCAETGWYRFSKYGYLSKNQRALPKSQSIVVKNLKTRIQPSGVNASDFELVDQGPVEGWPGWNAFSLNTNGISRLTLSLESRRDTLYSAKSGEPEWQSLNEHENLRDSAGTPVLREPMKVSVPEDSRTWEIKTYAVQGNLEELVYYVTEVQRRESFEPVLPGSKWPWVGQFRCELSVDGQLKETRRFSIAESLHVKLSYSNPSAYSNFLVPIYQGDKFISSSYQVNFTSDHSEVIVPQGWHRGNDGTRALPFEIHGTRNPNLHSMQVFAHPRTTSFWIPLKDTPSSWTNNGTNINIAALDPDAELKIRFPQAVFDPELVLQSRDSILNDSGVFAHQKRIPLKRSGRSHIWCCSVSLLLEATKALDEHLLTVKWFDERPWDYVSRIYKGPTRDTVWQQYKAGGTLDRGDGSSAIFARFTSEPLLKSCSITDSSLRIILGQNPSGHLNCWAWKLEYPLEPPLPLQLNDYRTKLPEELRGKGPLLVEIREEEFLDYWTPEYPSQHARIADQPFTNSDDSIIQALGKSVTGDDIRNLWNSRLALGGALSSGINRDHPLLKKFDKESRAVICAHPRLGLNEIDHSKIPSDQQIEAFIRTGLVFRSFETQDTAGEIHPVQWVGILQELTDIWTLRQSVVNSLERDDEMKESAAYINAKGGEILLQWLAGNRVSLQHTFQFPIPLATLKKLNRADLEERVQNVNISPLINQSVRTAGLAQVVVNRSELSKLKRLTEAMRLAKRKEFKIKELGTGKRGLGTAIDRILMDLFSHISRGSSSDDPSLWVCTPYISLVFTFLARLEAHQLIHPVRELEGFRNTWAQIARNAPLLCAYDLICVEALILGIKRETWK